MKKTLLFLLLYIPALAFGQTDYEEVKEAADEAVGYADCILENMKGVTSDVAAQAIKEACEEKHKEDSPRTVSASVPKLHGPEWKFCLKYPDNPVVWQTTLSCGASGKEITPEEYAGLESVRYDEAASSNRQTAARVVRDSTGKVILNKDNNSVKQGLVHCMDSIDRNRVYRVTAARGCQGGGRQISSSEYSRISNSKNSSTNTGGTSSGKPSVGEVLEAFGNVLGGYPADATAEERRDIDRQKADDCEQALRMNAYRKINGQSQRALPIECY